MFARSAFVRLLSTTGRNFSEAEKKVSKEALMALRKRTGYSYVNCRKALVKFGENDMDNAEKWLKEAAAKEGWAKAAKLGTRVTSNGLVSVVTENSSAAVVELSCETDFVARSGAFKDLLTKITNSALIQTKSQSGSNDSKLQEFSYELGDLSDQDGKNMREVLSLAIGKLGENMAVKRVKAYKAPEGTKLFGASHPKDGTDQVPMGRFISLIAMKQSAPGSISSQQLAGQICQHIIGMSPETLGEAAESVNNQDGLKSQEGHDPDAEPVVVTNLDDSETALLRQAFMLNPSQSVHEYLKSHNANVLDFVRVELGSEQ
ncbi:CBN-TSFM-1 protein [Caenorhabditis brenneri]|uniref:Elongation factor Ts, mitochondrial n=1 Tax=Caenorhabditis brenneri TaxID=135651 RepID=G0MP86_CAEBE|nr:CBN-TSFM-1 protein [Caenorhabditis brenneri]